MIRVIAIDDEPLALRQLEMYVAKVPFLTLVAACSSAAAARPHLEGADAIFLDVDMPDLSGMDFVKSLSHPPAVVFTTAYSEYAVEGFRVNAVDYLLKPFSFNEFLASCEKLRKHLEIKIVWVESMSEYVKLYLSDSDVPVVVLYSLKRLVEQLPADRFMRIHRSYIISLEHIAEASRTSVRLDNGKTLPVGELYRPAFAEYLAAL